MRRLLLTGAMILAVSAGTARAGETVLADPKPSMENPRRILLTLESRNPDKVNAVLSNAMNIQKFYGMDSVEIRVVAYGPGVRAVLKDSAPAADRVESLQVYGIEFVACGNTLDTIGKTPSDLLDGVDFVQAGLPEVVERQLAGWTYVRP